MRQAGPSPPQLYHGTIYAARRHALNLFSPTLLKAHAPRFMTTAAEPCHLCSAGATARLTYPVVFTQRVTGDGTGGQQGGAASAQAVKQAGVDVHCCNWRRDRTSTCARCIGGKTTLMQAVTAEVAASRVTFLASAVLRSGENTELSAQRQACRGSSRCKLGNCCAV